VLFRPPPKRVVFRPGDSAEALAALPGAARLEVVLSNHLTRYALLPWSAALKSDEEWLAYARHVFGTVYGPEVSSWRIRICDGGRGKTRVACAVDAALVEALARVERIVSIQPHLMAAFNARRSEFEADPGWFVLHEPGRLALGLVCDGEWKLLRMRQAPPDWRADLPTLLHRESESGSLSPCTRVVVSTGIAS